MFGQAGLLKKLLKTYLLIFTFYKNNFTLTKFFSHKDLNLELYFPPNRGSGPNDHLLLSRDVNESLDELGVRLDDGGVSEHPLGLLGLGRLRRVWGVADEHEVAETLVLAEEPEAAFDLLKMKRLHWRLGQKYIH